MKIVGMLPFGLEYVSSQPPLEVLKEWRLSSSSFWSIPSTWSLIRRMLSSGRCLGNYGYIVIMTSSHFLSSVPNNFPSISEMRDQIWDKVRNWPRRDRSKSIWSKNLPVVKTLFGQSSGRKKGVTVLLDFRVFWPRLLTIEMDGGRWAFHISTFGHYRRD